MHLRLAGSFLIGALSLAACGGGGASAPSTPSAKALVAGKLVLTISQPASAAAARTPKYISNSAVSVSISANGGAPTVADISSSSPNCTTTVGGRACTVPLVAPVGNDTFTIAQYDGPNASGTLLGSGTAVTTVIEGQPFVIQAVLNGAVKTIQLTLGAALPEGLPGNTTLTVVALDPDGNTIVGPGQYVVPISLSVADPTHQTTLSSMTVTGPSATPVTVTYAGGAGVSATITASASGATPASVIFTPAGGTIPGCNGTHLYVNDDLGGLVRYALPITSSSQGTQLNTTSYNVWLAFDPQCNMYLTQFFSSVNEYIFPYTGSAVASYGGAASGDPYGVAVDGMGNVFIAEAEANQVIELSSITGSVITTISVTGPYALALDANSNLYIGGSNGIAVYAPFYTAASPTETILAGTPVLGIAFGPNGDLFAGSNNNTVTVLAPPYGNSNVIATITSGVHGPLGLAVDTLGNVYVPNYNGNTITAYAPPYTGAPFATLPGDLPDGDAIGP
jgi:hypothetical protein